MLVNYKDLEKGAMTWFKAQPREKIHKNLQCSLATRGTFRKQSCQQTANSVTEGLCPMLYLRLTVQNRSVCAELCDCPMCCGVMPWVTALIDSYVWSFCLIPRLRPFMSHTFLFYHFGPFFHRFSSRLNDVISGGCELLPNCYNTTT